jgi:hypothetical protein
MEPVENRPSDLPHLFPRGEYIVPVSIWADSISRYDPSDDCHITRVLHCKCRTDKEHEFLVVRAIHNESRAAVILATDRSPKLVDEGSSGRKLDGIAIASSSVVQAFDRVILSYDGKQHSVIHHFPSYDILCTLHYDPSLASPTLLQLSVILDVISKHTPEYSLYESQCYWFAGAAWDALECLFPTRKEKKSSKASSYLGLHIPREDQTPTIVEQYTARWEIVEQRATELERGRAQREREVRSCSKV